MVAMCGIVAVSGEANQKAVRSAVEALGHRGPDDSGIFTTAGVALGHTRLAILDRSRGGHQPMFSSDGSVVIAFNGEIYNFRELRARLTAEGSSFKSDSDTEVLLEMYRACGEAMLSQLNGVFAFALWDADRGAMLIARDALGVKPLYFSEQAQHFSCASEIKALQQVTRHTRELDHVSLHRYLSFLWCPGEGTPLTAVRKLGPGEALWVRDGRIERRFTWYRLPILQRRSGTSPTEGEAVEGTVKHLRQAVHGQMVSDVPVGAFLSGGLDSSSVVTFAREIDSSIRCFTIESVGSREQGWVDDLPFARRVAAHLKVPLEIVSVDSARMAHDLEKMVACLDEPLADPASLNVLYISAAARSCGIKVLLSGAGGDDIFSGYRRHRALQLEKYWRWLPDSVLDSVEGLAGQLDQRGPSLRRARKLLSGATLKGDAKLVNYFLWSQRSDLLPLYTRGFLVALADASAETPMLDFLAKSEQADALSRMLALEQRFFLADHNLIYTDKMSMSVGVETRVPFLDVDLVAFAASIPSRLKQRGNVSKWVLKKAMEPYLPHDVIYRSKSGFGAPLRHWMRSELRELVSDVLSESSLRRRGLFDAASVHRLIQANDEGRVDGAYTLLSLMCIELWCRQFIDQTSRTPSISEPENLDLQVGLLSSGFAGGEC